MKLVVGLGNPGRKYEGTRHNIGFAVVQELARRHGSGSVKEQFQGETLEITLGRERVLLLCPQTFMNLSGGSVLAARDFFKLELTQILIVCDDFNLPLGRLRVRARGSAGGQKGLADVMRRLGTEEVPRLRVGIGPPPPEWNVADYVLSRFSRAEAQEMEFAVVAAADAVAVWNSQGLEACMNRFNAAGEKDKDP